MFHELDKVKDVWNKLQFILTRKQKYFGFVILCMTLIGAIAETLGVSIIIPFVQAMVEPEQLMQNKYLNPLIHMLNIESDSQLILLLGIGIALVYIIKNLYLTLLSYCRVKYSTKVQRELSILMMESYMKRGYRFFVQVNTGDLLRGVMEDVKSVYKMIYNAFRVIAELFTSFAIIIFIMVTDFKMALSVIVLAGICFICVTMGFRRPMQRLGLENQESYGEMQKHLLQAFQGIKEVIVMHRQHFFVKRYESAVGRNQKAEIGQIVASESPAYIIEAVCVGGLILTVSLRVSGMDATEFIPQLAAFAVGAFRILPSLGRITSSINQIVFYVPSLNKSYENLKEVRKAEREMEHSIRTLTEKNEGKESGTKMLSDDTHNYLEIENIHWRYPASVNEILSGVSMKIQKGTSVAFVGHSGAGKTTLADIILGLYRPQEGCIRLEGRDIRIMPEKWCNYVGYIPQSVYLIDDTVRNNVAFGVEEPNDDLIWQALEQAQLKEFVIGLPNRLDTIVGDRGVKFSGGQKQRVAIARALYNDPAILILDEATSALDTETENAVMEAIDSLQGNKTLIIVAHRLTTIRNCDVIYEIVDGKAIEREKEEVLKG